MHMVIRALVYAENQQDALAKGKSIFSSLCDNGTFDYFTTFDEENSVVSGKARWGGLPIASKVTSERGKQLVEEGWKFTEEGKRESLKKIRKLLEKYDDEELISEEPKKKSKSENYFDHPRALHYECHRFGEYRGANTFLYDQDGEGILSKRHLDDVLTKWKSLSSKETSEKYKDLDVWVVPADVHH